MKTEVISCDACLKTRSKGDEGWWHLTLKGEDSGLPSFEIQPLTDNTVTLNGGHACSKGCAMKMLHHFVLTAKVDTVALEKSKRISFDDLFHGFWRGGL